MEIVQSKQPPCTDWQGRRLNNLGAVCGLTEPVTFSLESTPWFLLRRTVSAANSAESCGQHSDSVWQSGVRPWNVAWGLWRDWYLHGKLDGRAQIPEDICIYSSKLPKPNNSLTTPPTDPSGVPSYRVFINYHPKWWIIVVVIYSALPKPKVPAHLCLWSLQKAQ